MDDREDKTKLPRHVPKDGVKWLILPSKVVLDSLSMWPERQTRTTVILSLLVVSSFVFMLTGQLAFIFDKDTDLGTAADAIAGVIVVIETTGRRCLSVLLAKKISRILSTVYYEFWPSDIAGDGLHRDLNKRSWYVLVSVGVYTISALIWATQSLMLPIFGHTFALRSKFRFNYADSPYYEIIYIWQGILSIELAVNICGFDLFFISLIWNCVAQFRLLREYIQLNFERAIEDEGARDGERTEAMELVLACYRHHNVLIETSKEIEAMLTVFILMLYVGTVGTVCLSGFLLTVVRTEVGRPLTYFCGHMGQIFMYCFIGNELILESVALSDAVYRCGWHLASYDRDVRKALVLIMARAQRPVTITLGGFGVLSLTSYMKLLKFCFSFYTLLDSMMAKQDEEI